MIEPVLVDAIWLRAFFDSSTPSAPFNAALAQSSGNQQSSQSETHERMTRPPSPPRDMPSSLIVPWLDAWIRTPSASLAAQNRPRNIEYLRVHHPHITIAQFDEALTSACDHIRLLHSQIFGLLGSNLPNASTQTGVRLADLETLYKWAMLLQVPFGRMEVEDWRESTVWIGLHLEHATGLLGKLRNTSGHGNSTSASDEGDVSSDSHGASIRVASGDEQGGEGGSTNNAMQGHTSSLAPKR